MDIVGFRGISKSYGNTTVLEDLDLSIQDDEFHVIFGIPESGKSVLIRLLVGLEDPDEGRIMLRGEDVTDTLSGNRRLSYVPQSYALYPHYTVHDNIAYPLDLENVPDDEIETAVRNTAEMLQIDDLLKKTPDTLSGGEKQRVAIARGMVKQTGIYVFDDPLAGLDFKLRERLIDDLRKMQDRLDATFVYSTTEPLESMLLADSVSVLDHRTIIESGPVEQLYWKPKRARTMELLGFPRSNMFPGELHETQSGIVCRTDLFEFPVQLNDRAPSVPDVGRTVHVGVRPHNIELGTNGTNRLSVEAEVGLLDDIGAETIIYLDTSERRLESLLPSDSPDLPRENETVNISISPDSIAVFESRLGRRIGEGTIHG